ncbi:MAG: phosphoesterase [Desulfurococcus sp.]|jgi:Icc-related predicted phosphoesterase|uniref:metallophosphoesterase family protein n=2 Tax=Desulfurococcus sp. TaxID=51678 RepID=UPI003162E2DC
MTSKIFFSVDVHGSSIVWRKWIRAVEMYNVNVLILAGDLTGKVLVPIIKHSDGSWTTRYFGKKWMFKTEGEVREFEDRLEGAGVYYVRVDEKELEELKNNPKLVEEVMNEKISERLRTWLDLLTSRVDTRSVTTIVMPGNDDELFIDDIIRGYEDKGIIYPLDKVLEIEGHEVISSPYVNPTPWKTPREMDEKNLEKHLENLVSKLRNTSSSIFNFHPPPFNTHIDLAPKLTRDLRPMVVAGQVQYEHVGSKAVRKIIEKYQPLIGMHGHIHESGGMDKIGRTIIINPGSEYSEGVLRGFIVEVDREKLVNYWRIEG